MESLGIDSEKIFKLSKEIKKSKFPISFCFAYLKKHLNILQRR